MSVGEVRVGTYDGLAKEVLGRDARLGDVRLVAGRLFDGMEFPVALRHQVAGLMARWEFGR